MAKSQMDPLDPKPQALRAKGQFIPCQSRVAQDQFVGASALTFYGNGVHTAAQQFRRRDQVAQPDGGYSTLLKVPTESTRSGASS